jgi:hypothetical protein
MDCEGCGKQLDVKESIVYLFREGGRVDRRWRVGYFHRGRGDQSGLLA